MTIFACINMLAFVFEFVQLLLEMLKEQSSIQSFTPNLMWFCNYPLNVSVFLKFIFHKEELLSFFEDFEALERGNPVQSISIQRSYRRIYINVYITYALQGVGLIAIVCVIMFSELDASYLLSHYPILRDTLTIPVVVTFHLISVSIWGIHLTISNLVPAWTFYHCGINLESLAFEVECNSIKSNNYSNMKMIHNRFENVCRLTERANRLFGSLIVVDHLSTLFMTCVLSYTVLSRVGKAEIEAAVCLVDSVALIFFLVRFVIPVLMMAHLRTGFDRLRKAVVGFLVNNDTNPEKVNQATIFLKTIKASQSAARPLNLYDITPSTLLSFASLTVSYVIVLLQSSKWHLIMSLIDKKLSKH